MLKKTSSASLDRSVIFQPQNKPSEVESSSVYIIVCPAALVLDRKKLAAFSAAAGLAKALVATNSPGECTQYSSGKPPIRWRLFFEGQGERAGGRCLKTSSHQNRK